MDWRLIKSESEFFVSAAELHALSRAVCEGWGRVPCAFDVAPRHYVRFAQADLVDGTQRGNLNAIHNAKRAIDCQMDQILWNLGLSEASANSPRKFEILLSVEASAPELLGKLIRQRNLLEHEYRSASDREARDAVDIADLYVKATDRLGRERADGVYVWLAKQQRMLSIDPCQLELAPDQSIQRARTYGSEDEAPNAVQFCVYGAEEGVDGLTEDAFWDWRDLDAEDEIPTADVAIQRVTFRSVDRGYIPSSLRPLFVALTRLIVIGLKCEDE